MTIIWIKYDEKNKNLLAIVADKVDKKIHLVAGDGNKEFVAWTMPCELLCNMTHFSETKFEVSADFYEGNSSEGKSFKFNIILYFYFI